jgi:hypothetical protein
MWDDYNIHLILLSIQLKRLLLSLKNSNYAVNIDIYTPTCLLQLKVS